MVTFRKIQLNRLTWHLRTSFAICEPRRWMSRISSNLLIIWLVKSIQLNGAKSSYPNWRDTNHAVPCCTWPGWRVRRFAWKLRRGPHVQSKPDVVAISIDFGVENL